MVILWDVTHSLETKSDITSRLPKSHIRKNGGNRILPEQVIEHSSSLIEDITETMLVLTCSSRSYSGV